MRIVYSPRYNIGLFGLERLHPFDARKYGRAWRAIRRELGGDSKRIRLCPRSSVRRPELLRVHTRGYLKRLQDSAYLAGALEVPQARYAPARLLDWCVLRPMRWATSGSVVGMRAAFDCGFAVNLGGGYHHAEPSEGGGFCIYSDIGLAVYTARHEGLIDENARVAYVDLDAHQGNGVSHVFHDDHRLFMFDMYNCEIYPCHDVSARERVDCNIPLVGTTTEREYLGILRKRLPGFLDGIASKYPVGFAIYNAGTDIYDGDPLGGLSVSAGGILERDLFVVRELRDRGIPTLMLLSGGYTKISYQLVASSVIALASEHGI